MALLNSGTVILVDEEATIGAGQGATWLDTDAIPFQDDSGLTPATESLERQNFNGSFLACKSLTGNESTSGSLNVEMALLPVTGTEAGHFLAHLVYKSGLGIYAEQAADLTVTNTISIEADPSANPTGYDLYRLSLPTESRTTLVVYEDLGGSGEAIVSKGVVVDSIGMNFSAGQIAVTNFSVSGIGYDALTGQTPFTSTGCPQTDPFVTKSAVFKVDGVSIDASDVSLTVNNTNVDRQYISSTGIGDKVTTAKSVELSYTLDMVTTQAYTLLKNNTEAELYISLVNTAGDEMHVYLPVVSYSEVSKNNDGGVLTLQISSMAYADTDGHALYIATMKA